jgi:putative inorganic carbon (HCO3(-)) transporter
VRFQVTWIVLLGLPLAWGIVWAVTRYPLPVTPFNAALLLWAIAVGVGVAVTAMPEMTLPKATGLVLGLAVWHGLAVHVTTRSRLKWAVLGFAALGLGMMGVGMLSVNWFAKIPQLRPVLERLPDVLVALPGAPGAGINPNQLAGLLTFLLPPSLALGVAGLPRWVGWRLIPGAVVRWIPVGVIGMVLIVTQSRSGWIGGLVGLAVLLTLWLIALRRLRVKWILAAWAVALLALGGIGWLWIGPERLQAIWSPGGGLETGTVGTISLSGRVEIWSRALYAIQDFVFTGTGLGTFREVVWILYPLFTVPPGRDIAHAHNIFLQVAVDTGVPGLIAYLALLGVAGWIGWRIAQTPRNRALALGLVAGLAGLHVYGLTDALAPGSKPGLILWYALGLLSAMSSWEDLGTDAGKTLEVATRRKDEGRNGGEWKDT